MTSAGRSRDEGALAAAYRAEAAEWWAEARLRRERAEREAAAMEARAANLAVLAASLERRVPQL